ncbi:hypothetical protein L2E82_39781 [Cichorium intybus]|uniref:Uncharacterized protein n=1 Tax=Cichorium intybus TaxID=13427 RepID=A0ACB9AJH4_CICIN|nr:hypothetical protein L2E82_39781 [Cichorium intybus]
MLSCPENSFVRNGASAHMSEGVQWRKLAKYILLTLNYSSHFFIDENRIELTTETTGRGRDVFRSLLLKVSLLLC